MHKPSAPSWLTDNIEELSKNVASAFTIYVSVLAYCALSLFITTDRQLVLNGDVSLPIVGLSVPFDWFCLVSPIILAVFFLNLQLYVARLAELTRKVKEDYTIDNDQLYPSILNLGDDQQRGVAGVFQVIMVGLL